ncbi:MAG: 4'-phosphopantetheinyl transferase family protein, partial [Bacteroidota bacterium]
MPIVHTETADSYKLAVWESTETESDLLQQLGLSAPEQEALHSVSSATRRKEVLTVKRLLKEMTGSSEGLQYDSDGKPSLSGGNTVSITHSRRKVGIILSKSHPVGIDIEKLRPQIRSLSSKFVSPMELEIWGHQPDDATLHLIWGAKEVLFKLYSKGGIDFRKDLLVEKAIDG